MYYQPIVLTVQKNIDFNKAFQISFMHICEHFNDYSTYATLPLTCKKKKKVTFSDVVQVRLIVEEQFEYHELLTQYVFYFIFYSQPAEWNSGIVKWMLSLVP